MSQVTVKIDGKEIKAEKGQMITEVARNNGIYIPTLCDFQGMKPAGTCRICTVKVNGRNMAACTTPVDEGMNIENKVPDLEEMRKAIVEMLFVEGNHFCPVCEKSGNCELQAMGYKYLMMVPRFPYTFPRAEVRAEHPKLMLDENRCIQCLRCGRGVKTADGKNIFGLVRRGDRTNISFSVEAAANMTDQEATRAMELCPVGTIIKKEVGFAVPIGKRKYDSKPIGSEIEK